MRIWTSITASTDTLRGISGVLRTGDAVFTSTSQRVSAWAGMGFDVLGSTWERETTVMSLRCRLGWGRSNLLLLEHLDNQTSLAEQVSALVYLRPPSRKTGELSSTECQVQYSPHVAQSGRERHCIPIDFQRRPWSNGRLRMHSSTFRFQIRVQHPTRIHSGQ